jgi:solute carrier family 25 phosphate transporter 23/24/25/41
MDQDHSLQISFDEWRSFFMVNPVILESITNDPREMLRYWRSASVSDLNLFEKKKGNISAIFDQYLDLGESPYGTPEDALTEGGQWWKNLIAGGLAGAVSRTATAPFDRLKIVMQVENI